MIKIVTLLGTRPEIIRLSRIISIFDDVFEHKIINTNQNFTYELNEIFFTDLNIRKPDYEFNNKNSNSFLKLSEMLSQTYSILKAERPDAIFILGDTDSSLCSIIAKKLGINLFHFEAGNRCFNNIVPEEINRKIIDSISDINFTYSEFSRQNLINEGKTVQDVICVGSPMKEVLCFYWKQISNSNICDELGLHTNKFSLLSLHRQECVDNKIKLEQILKNINNLAPLLKNEVVWPLHPRTYDKIIKFKVKIPSCIRIIKPLSFIDYIKLQCNSFIIMSDSGTLAEESSLLGLKSLNIREQFERQEIQGFDLVPLVGFKQKNWETGIKIISNVRKKDYPFSRLDFYNKDNVSDLITTNILNFFSEKYHRAIKYSFAIKSLKIFQHVTPLNVETLFTLGGCPPTPRSLPQTLHYMI